MPSILQIYSNNLSNTLVTSSIEFLVKQLYILHRKPFLLQMFGSIANSLESKDLSDPFKVHPRGLYQLVQSLERPANDILQVMELVKMKKPLSSLDFCYNGEGESINVQECISICGMVAAYDSGTTRANEMLTVLDALIPIFLKNVLKDRKAEMKDIREIIHQLSHTMKTIIHNSDKLAQMYTGPMRNEEMRSTSQHYQGKAPYSPVIEIDDDSHSKFIGDSIRGKPYPEEGEDSETKRENFRYPRNCLLNFSADFLSSCSAKLNEINKKSAQEKTIELVDIKCYIRLNEVASSMIKMAPYDQETLQSPGLHKYMKLVLPNTDWSGVSMKPVITSFLRRLDKMVAKIHKNQRIYVSIDWKAVSIILSGVYETVWNYPHVIVSLPNFKNLVTTCQNLVLGEDQDSTVSNYRRAILPSQDFCSVVFKLISLQVLALGEAWTLEQRLQSDSFSSSNVQIVQQERKNDILYSLNLILGLIQSKDANPAYKGKFKQAPINVKVGFLGLRVLITCYSDYLAGEWHRIARTIRNVYLYVH
ncbi:protein unc-80 homolog [Eurytemora carolleeae]|uniref:protein unc-80 homolog n=1 Tax=Eurytemora carolleeae TaxID=1294199 RepID=UPI000C794D0D|nr:protein unc-80 homolog [Eurytemora carolleeae]|eukprot:XP_023345789.1 protein unc-80 homolog [Eurytemora affinis]